MTKVFSIRLDSELYNIINKEIEEQGLTRKEWLLGLYNENKSLKKPVYTTVYKQTQHDEYNLLCKTLDSVKRRLNGSFD